MCGNSLHDSFNNLWGVPRAIASFYILMLKTAITRNKLSKISNNHETTTRPSD